MYSKEQIEQMKQQWKAMGVDPEMMLQHMENSMKIAAEAQQNYAAFDPTAFGIDNTDDDDFFSLENDPSIKEDSDITDESLLKDIACGSNLAFLNCEYLNTLETFKPYEQILASLEMDWGITDREELLSMLDFLHQEGHRKLYNVIWNKLKSVPMAEWAKSIEEAKFQLLTENSDYENIHGSALNIALGYKLMKKCGCFKKMKEPNILSWDLGRAINLVRWGYDVKFLSKDEAIELIRKYASEMRAVYNSWDALSEGYLMGFIMWSGDEEELADLYEDQQVLLTHADSPWMKHQW